MGPSPRTAVRWKATGNSQASGQAPPVRSPRNSFATFSLSDLTKSAPLAFTPIPEVGASFPPPLLPPDPVANSPSPPGDFGSVIGVVRLAHESAATTKALATVGGIESPRRRGMRASTARFMPSRNRWSANRFQHRATTRHHKNDNEAPQELSPRHPGQADAVVAPRSRPAEHVDPNVVRGPCRGRGMNP